MIPKMTYVNTQYPMGTIPIVFYVRRDSIGIIGLNNVL